ncbi:MAG: histidine phosphatase family protein [Gammaproteobacteria bacterium]
MEEQRTRLEVDLIRHGEPVGGRRYRGCQNDSLSEQGWRQMEQAVVEEPAWQHIVTSPLSRCRDFALALGERQGIAVSEEPRFREIGFGSWEGRSAAELRAEDPDCLQRFYHDPVLHRPPGAESLADFMVRVVAAWEDVLAAHPGRRLLIVAHAGVMRALVAHVLGMPVAHLFRLQIGNAALLRIRGNGERPPALLLS